MNNFSKIVENMVRHAYGAPRGFGSQLARAVTFRNPWKPQITVASVAGNVIGRSLVTGAGDALILSALKYAVDKSKDGVSYVVEKFRDAAETRAANVDPLRKNASGR